MWSDASTAEGNSSHATSMVASMGWQHTRMAMTAFRGQASGQATRNAVNSTSGATARHGHPATATIRKPPKTSTASAKSPSGAPTNADGFLNQKQNTYDSKTTNC